MPTVESNGKKWRNAAGASRSTTVVRNANLKPGLNTRRSALMQQGMSKRRLAHEAKVNCVTGWIQSLRANVDVYRNSR